MSAIWTAAFWRDTAERAIKTAAQTLAGTFGGDAVGLFDIDWSTSLSVTAGAVVLSVLMSVGSDAVTRRGDASALPRRALPVGGGGGVRVTDLPGTAEPGGPVGDGYEGQHRA